MGLEHTLSSKTDLSGAVEKASVGRSLLLRLLLLLAAWSMDVSSQQTGCFSGFTFNGIQQPPALITVLQLIPVLLQLSLIIKLFSGFSIFLGGGGGGREGEGGGGEDRCEAER